MTPRHFTSRKFLGFLLTGGTLAIAALIVKNGNYPALATGLVALFTSFSAANTVAGMVAPKTAKPDEEGS